MFCVKGDLVYSKDRHNLTYLKDGYLIIKDGFIKRVTSSLTAEERALPLLDYSSNLIVPGLSDLHIHAPQYQFRGLWMDMELLDWLNSHTFPEEAKYKDLDYAKSAYSIFVKDLILSPTTRISAFGTMHKDATLLLMNLLDKAGFKGYVGKVNMDRNSPSYLIEDSDESIRETISFIDEAKSDNIKPIITPRFIPTCTDKLLMDLASIAKERLLPVQSHLSENLNEIKWVKELSPLSQSYADAYKRVGLWGRTPTIMAHCVYSDTLDGSLMENDNIYIAHCPDSNTNLVSGVANAQHFIAGDFNIGLGSDIAGGTSLSLFSACTDAIKVSKLRKRLFNAEDNALTFAESFYMASKGSGSFFGHVGSFEKDYEADFIVLNEDEIASTLMDDFTPIERLERYAYLSPLKAVKHKCIGGKLLF